MEQVKTVGLLALLSVLMVFVGGMLGGQSGMLIALVLVGGMNFYSYFYSDKMVLRHYDAQEVDERSAGGLFAIVRRLTQRAGIPMPKVYIIADQTPNAFATGRNPENAAVAVTEGLLNMLDENEVEAVIAHELSHVRHYDILIGTVAATIAGAIAMIANMMQFSAMFGGRGEGRPNPLVMIVLSLILPIAAMVIQMSVSRSREYMADEGAARLTGHPEWLQSGLAKLSSANHRSGMRDADEATAHMFIVNPLSAKHLNMAGLFRTHPSTEDRIARLETIKREFRDTHKDKLYNRS